MGVPLLLVVIDTLSRALAGGNENAPDGMGAFVRNIDRIRTETGACCVLVHHTGKDGSKGARGHSLLRAAVDTEIEIVRGTGAGGDKLIHATLTKQKDAEAGAVFGFRLEPVRLGTDEDGDAITSCVVVSTDAPAKSRRRLTDRNKLTLGTLVNLIANEGEDLPKGTRYPTGGHLRGVKRSAFRREFNNRCPVLSRSSRRRQGIPARVRKTAKPWVYCGLWRMGLVDPTARTASDKMKTVPPGVGDRTAGQTGHTPIRVSRVRSGVRPDMRS